MIPYDPNKRKDKLINFVVKQHLLTINNIDIYSPQPQAIQSAYLSFCLLLQSKEFQSTFGIMLFEMLIVGSR